MYTITKRFTFEAAHRLVGHPKCGRLHGHSYVVEVELSAEHLQLQGTDQGGMVRDYGTLAPIKQYIDESLDHRFLYGRELDESDCGYLRVAIRRGDAAELSVYRTTAEELARYLFGTFKEQYPELTAVTVCETANTTATYREG